MATYADVKTEAIRAMLRARRMTQRQLAAAMGRPPASISRLMANGWPNGATDAALQAMGATPGDLAQAMKAVEVAGR